MIRVAVLADTLAHAERTADLLAEDDRLEIIEARAFRRADQQVRLAVADVLVTFGLLLDQIPLNGPPVVALTDESLEEAPLGLPTRAWLPLNSPPSEMAAAILAAANDLVVLTRSQVDHWRGALRSPHAEAPLQVEKLTGRELQVLRMMADGLGNKQIAAELDISDHTAKFHVAQILAKLGASSRAEAVAIGIRRGLVPI